MSECRRWKAWEVAELCGNDEVEGPEEFVDAAALTERDREIGRLKACLFQMQEAARLSSECLSMLSSMVLCGDSHSVESMQLTKMTQFALRAALEGKVKP